MTHLVEAGHPAVSHGLLVLVHGGGRLLCLKTVYAHGMWLDSDGRKMGKTIGNVIEVDVLHEHFQVDALRYFVLRDGFGQDGKFGYENLIELANADLASGLGNLASRTFSMITKYREGLVPNGKIVEEIICRPADAGIDPDGGTSFR
ncbi:MAG: class I tRNA ligase family protein [Acidobacteria bacterium]|nr:class I tRNA ligase family protein [Acidobacteriota bacterium]